MRKQNSSHKIWFTAFLLLVFGAGCGDPDKTGNPGTTPPTVISVTPSNGVCPDTTVTATFSEAMNPATINTTTFTLTDPGGASVAGAVSYDVPSRVATFTQTSPPLALDTTYTATITTGALDLFGIPLATDFVWTFTTSANPCPGGIPLGTACGVGILAGSTVTNTGPSHVTGDVDVSPGTAITGFDNAGGPGTITGSYHAGDATAAQAQLDLTTAYNDAAGAAGGQAIPADIGGETLFPGVYKTSISLGITGNLTLDAQGDPNAVWIFQIGSTLTTAAGNSQVILSGGAQAQNVFWQVGSSATLGTNTIFEGTIMAQASITLTTGATLNGRALARTGAVTLDNNQVNVPPCP